MSFDKEIEVDMWKTGAHAVEIGIKKEAELRSKSRQFSKDMDIVGQVVEEKTVGYITFREEPWKLEEPDKYVVIKGFTKSINWKASLEQLVAKTMMQSVAADRAMPVFMINLSNSEHLVTLEKTHRKPSIGKSIYAFNLINDDLNVLTYAIETDRMSIGNDWFVFDNSRNKVAEIDGSKFNIGGKYIIRLNTELETYNSKMEYVLILFAALNNYLSDIEGAVEKGMKKIKDGKAIAKVSKEEAQLYLNPRRIKT